VLLNLLKSERARGATWHLREALYTLIGAESPRRATVRWSGCVRVWTRRRVCRSDEPK